MKTVTKNMTLVSSKLKKFDHDKGEYIFVEDPDQSSRLNQKVTVSYNQNNEGDFQLHSMEGPAIGKDHYINGVKDSRIDFLDVIRLMKKEETLKNN